MNKEHHEGELLKKYLKENKLKQEAVAEQLGYATRHGLIYHFQKPVLAFEFKQKLRQHNILLFNEEAEEYYKREWEKSKQEIKLLKKQIRLLNKPTL